MTEFILADHQQTWKNLLPLTYTRPISELKVGILTIREKWELFLKSKISYLTEDYLNNKYPLSNSDDDIFINSSILPNASLATEIFKLKKNQYLKNTDCVIAARCSKEEYLNLNSNTKQNIEPVSFNGNIVKIEYPWNIFSNNATEIISDFEFVTRGKNSQPLSSTNRVFGKYPVFLEEGVSSEFAIFNTTSGPIYLGKDSVVMEGSAIQGSFSLGEHSQVKLNSKIYPGTSIGAHCKVGGELNNVVFIGYSNKAHDGFLGNAVIGEWCNIGADTNNSNLKNTYENVKVWNYPTKSFIDSGLQFCGLFMGDHSKCGINTMFNTGTVAGVSANIFGAGFPRTFIPSFSWGGATGMTTFKLEKAFESMKLVMSRRNIPLTEDDKSIISHIFEISKEYRH